MIDDLGEHRRTFVKARPSDWHTTEALQGPFNPERSVAAIRQQPPIGGSYAWTGRPWVQHAVPRNDNTVTIVDRPTAKDRPGCDHMRSTKRMCVVCCVVRPAPQHELLRAAGGGAQAAWVWCCSGCVDQYRRSRVILDERAMSPWQHINGAGR